MSRAFAAALSAILQEIKTKNTKKKRKRERSECNVVKLHTRFFFNFSARTKHFSMYAYVRCAANSLIRR